MTSNPLVNKAFNYPRFVERQSSEEIKTRDLGEFIAQHSAYLLDFPAWDVFPEKI